MVYEDFMNGLAAIILIQILGLIEGDLIFKGITAICSVTVATATVYKIYKDISKDKPKPDKNTSDK
jgi:hypothetical protein